jgi:carbonic anhydrase
MLRLMASDETRRLRTGDVIMNSSESTEPAEPEGRHEQSEPHFRDALGLIEMLHQRVQDEIRKETHDHSAHGRFCTVFNCIDGRCQRLVHAWCERELGIEYADTITIAGCDSVLVTDPTEAERAFKLAKISVDSHGARDAVIAGHSSCAANKVSNDQHRADVERATAAIAQRGLYRSVTGLFVDVDNNRVDFVCRIDAEDGREKAVA